MDLNTFRKLTDGHFATVTFVKKNGEKRVMNFHPMTKRYIKGTGNPVVDGRAVVLDLGTFRKNLKEGLHRFEAGAKAYRSFWPDTIIELRVGKKVYDKNGEEMKDVV